VACAHLHDTLLRVRVEQPHRTAAVPLLLLQRLPHGALRGRVLDRVGVELPHTLREAADALLPLHRVSLARGHAPCLLDPLDTLDLGVRQLQPRLLLLQRLPHGALRGRVLDRVGVELPHTLREAADALLPLHNAADALLLARGLAPYPHAPGASRRLVNPQPLILDAQGGVGHAVRRPLPVCCMVGGVVFLVPSAVCTLGARVRRGAPCFVGHGRQGPPKRTGRVPRLFDVPGHLISHMSCYGMIQIIRAIFVQYDTDHTGHFYL
jgi:hypothetical protein